MPQKDGWRPTWWGSIRVRLVSTMIALLVLSSASSIFLIRVALLDDLDQEIELGLEREVAEFRLLAGGTDPRTGRPFGDDVAAIFDVYFAREVPDEGETLLAFVDGELYASRRAQGAAAPDELSAAIAYWLSLPSERRGVLATPAGTARYVALPVSGRPDGLFVAANFPAFERQEIDQAVRTAVVVGLGTLLVGSLLAVVLAGRILSPLRRLAATALSIQDTNLNRRIPVTRRGEASEIASAFNAMLERLERSFTTQRQFLEDTSHELRSPMTVIRGHVELLELDESPAERAETVALVLDEVDRVTDLLEDLTLLARAEHPGFVDRRPVDLGKLVVDVHRKCTALGAREWIAEAPDRLVVAADGRRLTQALMQLASNAVNHTQPGQTIRIGAGPGPQPDSVRLWVDDSGRGVPEHDAEVIFQRFARGTSPIPGRGGRGLGLAIVSAIAGSHHGAVRLVSRPGPGARFEITIPRGLADDAHGRVRS